MSPPNSGNIPIAVTSELLVLVWIGHSQTKSPQATHSSLNARAERRSMVTAVRFRKAPFMRRNCERLVSLALASLILGGLIRYSDGADRAPAIRFTKSRLDDKFRSEGVAVADFNNDGRLDIAAGFVWYAAPEWKLHVIASQPPSPSTSLLGSPPHFDPKGYSNSFCCFAEDRNDDGWMDLIVVDFPGTPTWWFENPKGASRDWKRHLCVPVTNNESPDYLDLDGDGRRELVAAMSPDPKQPDGPGRKMMIASPDSDPTQPWQQTFISESAAPGTRRYSHGLGVGDLSGDGRNDVLCADGWWESPAVASGGTWDFHAVEFGERPDDGEGKAAQLLVHDFDRDGDNDVLSSSPHSFGLWWHEQRSPGEWRRHQIDDSFSQMHGVCLADINGDGLMDFVTGKRWWAHGGRDPGGDQPAVFCWFELRLDAGRPGWIRHQFDHDSGPGTQFVLSDVNADGLMDVVSSNKKGVYYFQQKRD